MTVTPRFFKCLCAAPETFSKIAALTTPPSFRIDLREFNQEREMIRGL